MKKLAFASLIIAGFGAGSMIAIAQDGPDGERPHHPRLEKVDLNGDGNISLDELQTERASRFDNADANGDGEVTLEEFSAAHEAMRAEKRAEREGRRFAKMDANSDGVISAEEHAAHGQDKMQKRFDRIDSNDDGVISEAERDAARGAMKQHGKRFKRQG